ncbi:MAG: ATP-grasp fold amidoligase family protein [Aequorivita sp.]
MKNIKKVVKKKLLNSSVGSLLFYRIRIARERLALSLMDDYTYIKRNYKKRYGTTIDLKNPKTLSEKLQWLKLFYRNENMPICSDKYDIKYYLQKHGYEHLLNKVIGVYETDEEIDNIDLKTLPSSFVAKATHGSSWNLICWDKDKLDWKLQKKIFKHWLKLNLFVFGREWNYKDLKPKILFEEIIDYKPLVDYKVTCFNGEPKYFQINSKHEDKSYIDFYDMDWNKMGITLTGHLNTDYVIPPPPAKEKLIEIAKALSKEFPFVRVDFYNYEDIILIGELTFFTASGLRPLYHKTKEIEKLFGSYLELPEPNHNIKLYNKIKA